MAKFNRLGEFIEIKNDAGDVMVFPASQLQGYNYGIPAFTLGVSPLRSFKIGETPELPKPSPILQIITQNVSPDRGPSIMFFAPDENITDVLSSLALEIRQVKVIDFQTSLVDMMGDFLRQVSGKPPLDPPSPTPDFDELAERMNKEED